MDRNEIIEKAKAFLVDEFEVEEEVVTTDAPFHETLDLDSLDYVDLVVIVDDHFGFKMTADDFKTIKTFDDFYNFIGQHTTVNS